MQNGFIPFDGFSIRVDQHLIGSKVGVMQGSRICVSPAMWALMKDATPEELAHLLSHLRTVKIPELKSIVELMQGEVTSGYG